MYLVTGGLFIWDRREFHIKVVSDAFIITKSKKIETIFLLGGFHLLEQFSRNISRERTFKRRGKTATQCFFCFFSSLSFSLKGSLSAIPNPELCLILPFSFLRHLT